ncbi:MAG: chromate transporter [Bacilli bacterium]|nr:chromate transporter [Bacilli bacterium]
MLIEIFLTFLKIGLFTFGGGYSMIPLIQREAIEKRHWIDNDEFLDIIAIAESTPGPIAINSATYIGYRLRGFWGSLMATLGVVIPSFVVILLVSMFFLQFKSNVYIAYAFQGIRIGVAILIFNAALKIYKKVNKNWFTYVMILIGLVLVLFDIVPTLLVILIGGLVGILHTIILHRNGGEDNGGTV